MGKEIIRHGTADAAADDIDVAGRVGEQIDDRIEILEIQLLQRLAQIVCHRVGKAVQDMGVRRVRGPAVVLGYGAGERCFQFGPEGGLQFRKAAISQLPGHPGDGGSGYFRRFSQCGDRAEAGDRVVIEDHITQFALRMRERFKQAADALRDSSC